MNDKTQQQNTNLNDGGKTPYPNDVVWPDEFKEILTFLNIIKPHFNDFCVVHGQFRSRSNDSTFVVETYFGCFSEMDFIISDIKALAKMLSTLERQSKITVTTDDETVSFSDGYQHVKFDKLSQETCDNKFMSQEELDGIFAEQIDYDRPLIKETLPKAVVCNISKVSRELTANAVTFRHERGNLKKGCIVIKSSSGYGSAICKKYAVQLREELLTPMDKNHRFNATTLPYIFNKSEMTLDVKFFLEGNMLAAIHHTSIGQLCITIYTRSAYIEDEEDQS